MMTVRNCAAALYKGIGTGYGESRLHYLDNIMSCGNNLQTLIRTSFFSVVKEISNYLQYAEKDYLLELLSCLDWSFKARDFEDLLDLKVFKLLHTGVPKKLESSETKQNIVLESWQLRPQDKLTKEL